MLLHLVVISIFEEHWAYGAKLGSRALARSTRHSKGVTHRAGARMPSTPGLGRRRHMGRQEGTDPLSAGICLSTLRIAENSPTRRLFDTL
jgi:hypothetical protein